MPNKTKQVGVRLTDEEAEFLARFKAENAATPSEKLRAIIHEARLRHQGTEDYEGSLRLVNELMDPTTRIVRSSENRQGMHSELITRMTEWVPECMAYLIASNGKELELDPDELTEIEAALAKRSVVLMTSILQLAVTRSAPLYDEDVIRKSIMPVLELAQVIEKVNGN